MDFDEFLKIIGPDLDLVWKKYRRKSARKKIIQRIYALGLKGYGDYLAYLQTRPEEAEDIAHIMAVTVSRFFREKACWDQLINNILPALIQEREDTRIRILSAGCCGGEETYTMALIWKEYFEKTFPEVTPVILGIDLDDTSLLRASRATYHQRSLREVPPALTRKWFIPEKGNMFRVKPEITGMVRFDKKKLLSLPFPIPKAQDLILCRYSFFTYFKGERRLKAAQAIEKALCAGGVLMIGQKDLLSQAEKQFLIPWPAASCFFHKK